MAVRDEIVVKANALLEFRTAKPNPDLPAHPAVVVATKAHQLAADIATAATADLLREETHVRSL